MTRVRQLDPVGYALVLALAGCTEDIRLSSHRPAEPLDAAPAISREDSAPPSTSSTDSPAIDAGAVQPSAAGTTSAPSACAKPLLDAETLSLAVATDPCKSLAARTFRQGLCTCGDITLNAGLTADSFDSSGAVGAPSARGLGVGANGSFSVGAGLDLLGTLSVQGPLTSLSQGKFHIGSNVYIGGELELNSAEAQLDRELWISGNLRATNSHAHVDGNVYQSPGSTRATEITSSAGFSSEALTLAEPCPCAGPLGVDFIRARQRWVSDNDNAASGLTVNALAESASIELSACSRYFFDGADAAAASRWHSPGRAAVFIDHDLEIRERLEVDLGEHGELDVLVRGALVMMPGARIETTRPGALRLYVNAVSVLQLAQGAHIQASVYAPRAELTLSEEQTFEGALLVAALSATAPVHLHFDRSLLAANGCKATSCSRDADCPAPLLCESGQCQLTER